jgi:hypothetical protein
MAFLCWMESEIMTGSNDFAGQWQEGVRRVTAAYRALPQQSLQKLHVLVARLREQKCAMQALVAHVGAATHCAGCGGACCVAGKYHFTRADLLVYLAFAEPLFEPLFANGLCPYLGPSGCLIPAGFRPFNCITFNCELIEDLLSGEELASFYRMERELRQCYVEIRSLFPEQSMYGALLFEAPEPPCDRARQQPEVSK